MKGNMQLIKKIGQELDNEWSQNGHEKSSFPELSASYLEKYGDEISRNDVDYFTVLLDKDIPIGNSYFGDCSITLYRGQKFYIEIIFWHSAWTSIHEHGFSGAFLNLKGERLIGSYTYKMEKEIEDKLKKGVLKKEKADCMQVGEVRTIIKGLDGIHRTMCVEGLGISLVIRTNKESRSQYHFFSNGLAICSWQRPNDKIKKICTLLRIRRKDHFPEMVESLFEKLSLYELMHFLIAYYATSDFGYPQIKSLLSKREYGNVLEEALKEIKFEKNIKVKILNYPSYEMRKELAFMVLNYCT